MPNRREFLVAAATAAAFPVTRLARAAGPLRIRRDVMAMPPGDPFFSQYASAVKAMHALPDGDPRSWRNQALIHLNHCRHNPAQDFLHWHRHYITNFEAICAGFSAPDFALPYWNWSANNGRIPDPFFDLQDLNVTYWNDKSNAASANWPGGQVTSTGIRALTKGKGLQDDPRYGGEFTAQKIEDIRKLTNFRLFWGRLEGSPHNAAHIVTGGSSGHMGDGMSPLDPIFWLHHCNVDRIWAQWQAAGNAAPPLANDYTGQFVDEKQARVVATSAGALDISKLNFTYDALLKTAPGAMPLGGSIIKTVPLKPATVKPAATASAARLLGLAGNAQQVFTNVETRFALKASGLTGAMSRPRSHFALETLGTLKRTEEKGRILARFSDVMGPRARSAIVVNVFLNCSYLTPLTPSSDPHYAGSFAFFGPQGDGHSHGEFFIDVTQTLRTLAGNGRIVSEDVNVQLMPVPVGEGQGTDVTFSVGKVELISI